MKAAVYYATGDPSVLRYEEVPDPVCRPGGVLIDVKAIGIQGGDTLNRLGGEMASVPHIAKKKTARMRERLDRAVDFMRAILGYLTAGVKHYFAISRVFLSSARSISATLRRQFRCPIGSLLTGTQRRDMKSTKASGVLPGRPTSVQRTQLA